MAITLSAPLCKSPAKCIYLKASYFPRINQSDHSSLLNSSLQTTNAKSLDKLRGTHKFYGLFKTGSCGFPLNSRHGSSGFVAEAGNGSGVSDENRVENEEIEARGQSSMPERFRYLTKEAPEKPIRWPWLIVLVVMLYSWRAVLWELVNWKRTVGAIFQFLGYISKLALALVFHFIGDPLTSFIRGIETVLYTIRAFYSSIIAYAPIQELTTIIMLTSFVLAIAEATVPDSVNSQPYLLSFAGLIGFAAVKNYISELFFWILLVCMFAFAWLVKKRDFVCSTLPVAAVLHHSKNGMKVKEGEDSGPIKRVPIPLVCAALAIGLRVMARWAGYRHLTWMIV